MGGGVWASAIGSGPQLLAYKDDYLKTFGGGPEESDGGMYARRSCGDRASALDIRWLG